MSEREARAYLEQARANLSTYEKAPPGSVRRREAARLIREAAAGLEALEGRLLDRAAALGFVGQADPCAARLAPVGRQNCPEIVP